MSKHRGTKLHLAFFCGYPNTEKWTVTKARAWSYDDAFVLAARKMKDAGWPDSQKVLFLGHVA